MEVGDHLAVRFLTLRVLLPEDVRGGPGIPGEEQEQVVLEVVERLGGDLQRPGFHLFVRKKTEAGDAAEGGDILVLLADRLLEDLDLDAAGLLGQLLRMDQILLQRVERLQQRRGETPGRPEARASRHVGHAGDLQMRRPDPRRSQRFANQGMLHLVDRPDPLHVGVLDDQVLDECLVQRDIDVLVDGRGDDEPAVLAVVRGQVRPAAAQGNPQRATRDDQSLTPRRCARRSATLPGRRQARPPADGRA